MVEKYKVNTYDLVIFFLYLFINLNILPAQQTDLDTLYLKAGSRIEFLHTAIDITKDTVITVPSDSKYIIYDAPDSSSQNFYKNLREYSKKNKVLELLHNSIIVGKKQSRELMANTKFDKSFEEYARYTGKIIKRIELKHVRLFTGSVFDTSGMSEADKKGIFEKIHYDTKKSVVAKYLTFKAGEALSPYRISDSERILRNLSFIEDAKVLVVPHKADTSMVDVIVVTKDRFSWGFNLVPYSFNRVSTTLYNRNLIGNGWNFELKYMYNGNFNPVNGIDTKLDFINIRGWFVDATLGYYYDAEREGGRIYFSKPFVTVETKYGGGLELENLHSYRKYGDTLQIPYTYNYKDLWLAYQYPLTDKDRSKTVFIAGRIGQKDFTNRPEIYPDSNYYFYDTNLALGSLIYSKIDYYKSRLIYGFGITEDIPVGTRVGVTAGSVYDDFYHYNYLGLSAGHAVVNKKWGYVLFGFKWGSLFSQRRFQHGWLYLYGRYISPLIRGKRMSFRHFIRISYTEGYNEDRNYYVRLADEESIRGLNLNDIRGVKRFYFSYENVMFTPVNIFGFKVAMYAFGDVGFIGKSPKIVFNNTMYSGLGVGWRIKNESLVFRTIQLRLAYYPQTPAGGGAFGIDVKTKDTRLFQNVFPVKPEILDLR